MQKTGSRSGTFVPFLIAPRRELDCTQNVDQKQFSPGLTDAFLGLLDDRSPVVRNALLEKLRDSGDAGIAFLRSVVNGDNRILARHASQFLQDLKVDNPQADFSEFIRSLNYELETGAFLLSRTVYPDIEIGKYCHFLDEVALRCREIMVPPMSLRDQCRAINRVVFHEYGFRGNAEYYTDPRNSFLSEVIRRRRGIPITLSTLYILIAQRCGLTLEPVGIPGHFLVGCFVETTPFFIDPFENGTFRSPEEVFEHLRSHNVPPKLTYLAPTPIREVLCRNCRNLVNHYQAANQPEMSQLFARFVDEFEVTYRSRTRGSRS